MVSFDSLVLALFPPLTTHLKHLRDDPGSLLFPHDALLAVIAVTYCRYTVRPAGEGHVARLCWSVALGLLAQARCDYWLLAYAHLLSFGVAAHARAGAYFVKVSKKSVDEVTRQTQVLTAILTGYLIVGHLLYSLAYPDNAYSLFRSNAYEFASQQPLLRALARRTGTAAFAAAGYLLPLQEFVDARDILVAFVAPDDLYAKARHLLFVTFHIQVGMGFLGISFLRAEQGRKNALVKIEEETQRRARGKGGARGKDAAEGGDDPSRTFRRSAGPFILCVALPYMAQIVFYGGANMYAFHCFRDDVHRAVRLDDLFAADGGRFVATAASKTANLAPEAYAGHAETVVTTVYDMVNRNLFSLPKLMLVPGIVAKQPLLLLKITPLILLSDWIKSTIVAAITTEVERVTKEVRDLESMRTKVEQYDMKNAELIQRSGYESVLYTERKWISLTEDIQDKKARTSLMTRSKMYFEWLQRNFIMMALVDCALAKLIAVGKIFATDIFVYARAIEDTINFVLMRSRAESELATLQSSILRLRELRDVWDASAERRLLDCRVHPTRAALSLEGVAFARGPTAVRVDAVTLAPGVYAVTGANGAGKSTLFRVLMACASNRESVDLHDSIELRSRGEVQMPSEDVVEITQNFYFPLFSSPFDWIYNIDAFAGVSSAAQQEAMTIKLEEELTSLKFYPETQLEERESTLRSDLTSSQDDWFSDLSGGQKSKVELVRKVFLSERCPGTLLIDETFAPLDPESKHLVMQKLKVFCRDSVVLVIYHADVKVADGEKGAAASDDTTCVESSNFFTSNIHVENGSLFVRPVCLEN